MPTRRYRRWSMTTCGGRRFSMRWRWMRFWSDAQRLGLISLSDVVVLCNSIRCSLRMTRSEARAMM
jgi:hypothetical protein